MYYQTCCNLWFDTKRIDELKKKILGMIERKVSKIAIVSIFFLNANEAPVIEVRLPELGINSLFTIVAQESF